MVLVQIVSLILTTGLFFFTSHRIASAQTVHIPDPNLRTLLESALGKEGGEDITQTDMASLKSLQNDCHFLTLSEKGVWWKANRWICESDDTSEYKVRDLTGLEFATNLTELHLGRNQISDVSPLKDLTHLTRLSLGHNRISDVSPLKDLTHLTHLSLGRNQISDVSPLKDLTHLTHLSLIYNRVSDISPLENLTKLIELDLLDNSVPDVSPLKDLAHLTHLSLRSNKISDISPLKNLAKLTYISLRDNRISDISPLENLTNLIYVHIGLNYRLSDISPLKNLTNLIHLDFDDNQISDVSPLANLTGLKHLDASSNEIADISPLTNLTKLSWLDLDSNKRVDIVFLKDLTNLRYLDIHNNQISDVSPLKNLGKLTTLLLDHNSVSDISPLGNLINLRILNLRNNQISNVSSLRNLVNLTKLNIKANQISDFSPIAGLIENLVEYDNSHQTLPAPRTVDVNRDGIINILDLVLVASNYNDTDLAALAQMNIYPDVNNDGGVDVRDLVAIAAAMDTAAAAPTLKKYLSETSDLTLVNLEQWIRFAKQLDTQNPHTQKGIAVLEQLLAALTFTEVLPKETAVLMNYPNPFNPETWIPYQLAKPSNVNISIHAADGKLVQMLKLGHLAAGIYYSKSRAAYWDGRNTFGESVASGIYFYTVTANGFTATRKMLIRK